MVLVTSQGGATRESLLTVGVRALVGSLARVDAAVTSQGAGVTEWLEIVNTDAEMEYIVTVTFPQRSHM